MTIIYKHPEIDKFSPHKTNLNQTISDNTYNAVDKSLARTDNK